MTHQRPHLQAVPTHRVQRAGNPARGAAPLGVRTSSVLWRRVRTPVGIEIHLNVPKTPLCEREREWGAKGVGPEREREREREGRRERERERGGERHTEQESGANRRCGRVVGSS